ncbi:hypothetical protein HDU93_008984 [Gonapodya sp. JEL0774]|nr:hypothetical protein HDU93_008984 [Gonapodya sp. JEL0774]
MASISRKAKMISYEKIGLTRKDISNSPQFPESLRHFDTTDTTHYSVAEFFSYLITQARIMDAQDFEDELGSDELGNTHKNHGIGPLEMAALTFVGKYEAVAKAHAAQLMGVKSMGVDLGLTHDGDELVDDDGGLDENGGDDDHENHDHVDAAHHAAFDGIDALHRAALQTPSGSVSLAEAAQHAAAANGAGGAAAGVPQFFVVTTNPATGMMSAVPAGSLALNVGSAGSTPVIVSRGSQGQALVFDSSGLTGADGSRFEKKKGKHECTYPNCGRFFTRASNLRSHVRICHEGEKMFPCEHCDLKFSRKHDVVRHQSVHTGEKPHGCPHGCDRSFSREDALQRHIKAKHPDKVQMLHVDPQQQDVQQQMDPSQYQMSREEVNASLSALVHAVRMGAPLTFFPGSYANFSGSQVGVQVMGQVDRGDDGQEEVQLDDGDAVGDDRV